MSTAPVPWPRAWHDALYGTQGFYRSPEGPVGHFATSAAGIPHADGVLARAVTALARRHGMRTIVDLAAGRGQFTAAMAAAAPELALVGVDIVSRPPTLPDEVAWWISPGGASLPAELSGLTSTLVLAHEWLDVVPTTVARRDPEHGVWREILVRVDDGEQSLGHAITGAELAWLQAWTPEGIEVAEVGLSRDQAFADLVSGVDDGLVLAVDYGHVREQRPFAGSLTGYRAGRSVAPVPDGSMDITAHVAIDSLLGLAPTASATRQHQMLAELLGRPTTPRHDLAISQPSAYLQALAQHNADRVLREPDGLGDFWWVLATCTG